MAGCWRNSAAALEATGEGSVVVEEASTVANVRCSVVAALYFGDRVSHRPIDSEIFHSSARF